MRNKLAFPNVNLGVAVLKIYTSAKLTCGFIPRTVGVVVLEIYTSAKQRQVVYKDGKCVVVLEIYTSAKHHARYSVRDVGVAVL